MRRLFLAFTFFLFIQASYAQTVEETYPKVLWCPNDTFVLKFKGSPRSYAYLVSRTDEESPGTNAAPDNYATIHYGNDSVRLSYHNKVPYAHIIYINFESPKGKTTLRFHFNDLSCYFPVDYMDANSGNVQFDIPETYELANIIWTLSPSGQRATDLNKEGEYYKDVVEYFGSYLDHPVFKALDFPDDIHSRYYDFRENSFAFNFKDTKTSNCELAFNGPYYYVYGEELADSSLFGKLKPLVEDFAAKSKFREFYQSKSNLYDKEIKRQKELLPVKQMWSWLEAQFPDTKYQSFRIVSSPLIEGSHSTQRYFTQTRMNGSART